MIIFYNHNIWNYPFAAFRNKLVRSLVADFDADVCAFQECGPERNRVGEAPIMDLMNDVYVEATPEFADQNYTPVLYKKDKFNLLDKGYMLFDGKNDCDSKGLTWVVLEEKETLKRYAFISTHFWPGDNTEEDNQQRIQNARQVKEICEMIIAKYGIPVIVGGDINNGENSSVGDGAYKKMLEWGFRDIRLFAEETTDKFTCRTAYPILNEEDGTYTKCEVMPHVTIDNIFVYGNYPVDVKKFYIETNDKALTSSDHCPLIGYFDI